MAKDLCVGRRTIETVLYKLGIKKVWSARALTEKTLFQDKSELQRMLSSGMNASQIGERFGVHARTIIYWLKKRGISYNKTIGYQTMRRDAIKRAQMKQLRREEKESKRVAAMRFPGRGKGRVMTMAARLKSSISNACNSKKPSNDEKVFAKCVQATLYAFKPEQPVLFLSEDDKIIAACRADYYLPKGVIHPEYAVIIMFDGVWHHQRQKVQTRDRIINNVANHCGIIVVRLWSNEATNVTDGKQALNDILSRIPKLKRPVLIRHKNQIVNERTVKMEGGVACISTCLKAPTGKHEVYSKAKLKSLRKKIDRGDWVKVNEALQAFQTNC